MPIVPLDLLVSKANVSIKRPADSIEIAHQGWNALKIGEFFIDKKPFNINQFFN